MRDYEAKCETPPHENYPAVLDRAKDNVAEVVESLRRLADAIRGPRPEPAPKSNIGQIHGQRSLKDALDMIPNQINETCQHAEKQISEIRELLRL